MIKIVKESSTSFKKEKKNYAAENNELQPFWRDGNIRHVLVYFCVEEEEEEEEEEKQEKQEQEKEKENQHNIIIL